MKLSRKPRVRRSPDPPTQFYLSEPLIKLKAQIADLEADQPRPRVGNFKYRHRPKSYVSIAFDSNCGQTTGSLDICWVDEVQPLESGVRSV